jgi:hypothetical protein
MTIMRLLAALVLVGAAASVAAQAPSAWRVEKDESGIRIESRAVPGWEIREMRGAARFDGSVDSLVAVIVDAEVAPQLNEFVVEAKVVQRDNDSRYRVYTTTKMPWPLKDRDVLTQRVITRDAQTGTVTIADEAIPDGMPENKGLVRIRRSHTSWTFTPLADGGTQIELQMLSDPAGPIPSSLINSMSVGTPFKMIEKLTMLARQTPYSTAAVMPGLEASASADE